MRLADYVMRFVAQQGVKHVFLLTVFVPVNSLQ
jgi:hypothetical protein